MKLAILLDITNVAVTVSDLPASVGWYTKLFGVDPVLDENTGLDHAVFGCTLWNWSMLQSSREYFLALFASLA